MNRLIVFLFTIVCLPDVIADDLPRVKLSTSLGDIVVELDQEKAPVTVANFLRYVDEKSYDNNIFHRVIEGFMIQSGGHYADMSEAPVHESIRNEADNGLKNVVGSIAMARMNAIDSASRQFFINVADNSFLDHSAQSCTREDEEKAAALQAKGMFRPSTCKSFGYAVFGRVIEGLDVVRRIEVVATTQVGPHGDVPVTPISINSATRIAD